MAPGLYALREHMNAQVQRPWVFKPSDRSSDVVSDQQKTLYNMCITSAQRLRRWSNTVQMLQ